MESAPENNLFRRYFAQTNMKFDYEVNTVNFQGGNESKIYYLDKSVQKPVNLKGFWDSIEITSDNNMGNKKVHKKANCLQRLVSKKKKRFQNEHFDLDLSYITKRVIAMGFPSLGCEAIWRNKFSDIQKFLRMYHKDVKVYNLCLEQERIYGKERFIDCELGFFPFTDHQPCPIKLMLDFCVDICLHFINNPHAVAAVHCKAGKGRTGVMCVCYLIFSGLCKTSDEALAYYGQMRTHDSKGVTIPSQIRYIKYFEAFLSSNLNKPYFEMIPKIMKYYINPTTQNMLINYANDDSYFITKNNFILNKLKIGPFKSRNELNIIVSSLLHKHIIFPNADIRIKIESSNKYFFEINFNSDNIINYDVCLMVKGSGIKFGIWINLWYHTLEIISEYILSNKLLPGPGEVIENKIKETEENNYNVIVGSNKSFFFIEMKNLLLDNKEKEEEEDDNPKKFDQKSFKNLRRFSEEFYNNENNNEYDSRNKILEFVENLSKDNDLNKLIEGVNIISETKNLPLLNQENLTIRLNAFELDKFAKAKQMDEDFAVTLCFKLIG